MEEDKRKHNGGNSTKSKGLDKRKNNYRHDINNAFTSEDVIEVLRKCKKDWIEKNNIQAAKIFLENLVTKPTQDIDITSNGETIKSIDPIKWIED
tara:strand:- start:705 stop:989 length:285 start_codon:yes stop_codon:yes gene_type:complete